MRDSDDQFGPRFRKEEKSNKTCLIVGLILGGIVGVVLLCGGCGIGMYYFGVRQIASGVQATLAQNLVIQEHIGDIQSLEFNLMATGERGGGDMFVFDVTGSKGSGTIIAECIQQPGGAVDVVSGQLELANGEEFPLFSDDAAD
jgi:hypothetical protein